MLRWFALFIALFVPAVSWAQSFSKTDIDRILTSYELGAHAELQQLKFELLNSESGAKLLRNVPENSFTRAFVQFGQKTRSPSISRLETIALDTGFDSLSVWALTHDRIAGLANSALLAGWAIDVDDKRYDDPDYPDTLAFLKDRSVPWAARAVPIQELEFWCESLCVNFETMDEDTRVLSARYVEVVKILFPEEVSQ